MTGVSKRLATWAPEPAVEIIDVFLRARFYGPNCTPSIAFRSRAGFGFAIGCCMQTAVQAFRQAEAAYLSGRLEEAHALLAHVLRHAAETPQVQHLLALIQKKRGDMAAAAQAFERALALAPDSLEIGTNAGHFFLAQEAHLQALAAYEGALRAAPAHVPALRGRANCLAALGEPAAARAAFEHLLSTAPADHRNRTAYGNFLREQGEFEGAAGCYDGAIALGGGSMAARHGRARIALERGDGDAEARFAELERLCPDDPHVALGAAEALVARDPDAAIERMLALTGRYPSWPEAHLALNRLLWEAGDEERFGASLERALAANPDYAPLWRALIDLLAGIDRPEAAAGAAARAARASPNQGFGLAEAAYASEAGDYDRADALFAAAREYPGSALPHAIHLLRKGDPQAAEPLLEQARTAVPDDMLAWAWQGVAWRLLADPRAAWLHQTDRLIGVAGLGGSGEELASLLDTVRALHRARRYPVGQSLRGGTQTRGRLLSRGETGLAWLKQLIERAVARYWESLPPADERHPLLRHRHAPPKVGGSWSVRLSDGGHHVAHVHPKGLLSSACYLAVPSPEPGLLELGRPPLPESRTLPPLSVIKPVAGQLALFPSFMFHGTRPFSRGERITVAFDMIR
jgi:tetratricopeptide (TPR) repeat protein